MIKRIGLVIVLAALAAAVLAAVQVASSSNHHAAATNHEANNAALVARGQYLVTRVGMCGDCHTPMGPQGPDMRHWLQGGPLGFTPTAPVPGWSGTAPGIAGLPTGWSLADMMKFLQTGIKPAGTSAAPPMPAVRLSHRDAEAVAAYLASLPHGS